MKGSILIVDDEPSVRDSLRRWFQDDGFETGLLGIVEALDHRTAGSGRNAAVRLIHHIPNLLLAHQVAAVERERHLAHLTDLTGQPLGSAMLALQDAGIRVGKVSVLSPPPSPFRASILAWAVPCEPEMIAPAWPIFLPGGAVTPAM